MSPLGEFTGAPGRSILHYCCNQNFRVNKTKIQLTSIPFISAINKTIQCITINQHLRHNSGFEIYKLFDDTKFISSSNVSTYTKVITKHWSLNGEFRFCFKFTIKSNSTKPHATRLKSTKYKTHVIKECLLKVK